MRYAQIDLETGRCISVSDLAEEVTADYMIPLNPDDDVQPGDIYENGTWTRPDPPPQPEPGPSDIDILGDQLVEKELQILDLQQQNEALGVSLVNLELRLLSLEGGQAG